MREKKTVSNLNIVEIKDISLQINFVIKIDLN